MTDTVKTIPAHARKQFIRVFSISILFSLLFIAALGYNAEWDTIFSDLDAQWLTAAACGMTLMQFVSGYRLYRLLPQEKVTNKRPLYNAVRTMFCFQAIIKLLPFRLGEAGFFWLTRRFLELQFKETLGVFLSLRIWDLRIVALSFLLFSGLMLQDAVPWGRTVFIIVSIFGISVFMISSIRLIRLAEFISRTIHRLLAFKWADKLAASLSDAAETLVREKSFLKSLSNGFIAAFNWSCFYVVYYCIFKSVGVDIAWPTAVMVMSGMILVGVIPIQTLGGIGLVEFGQASLLVLAGLSTTMAATKSLAAGAIFFGLCMVVPAGLTAVFWGLDKAFSSHSRAT